MAVARETALTSSTIFVFRVENTSIQGVNLKCHVISLIKTDLSGFVVTVYYGLVRMVRQIPRANGLRIWLPVSHAPLCIVTTNPSRTSIYPLRTEETVVARVRRDPPLLQSAMDILWRLRFSRLRQAPSRKAWYSRGPVKSKIIASYVHENFYLWYFILPQIKVFPCSINITARLACTNNHTCSTDSLARLIIGFKSTK